MKPEIEQLSVCHHSKCVVTHMMCVTLSGMESNGRFIEHDRWLKHCDVH